MIKLTQINTTGGKSVFTFSYDLEGNVFSVKIEREDIEDRLKELKNLIGRDISLKDIKEVIITMINEIREGIKIYPTPINLYNYINVDLEA